jgi:hypothetical protein
LWFFLSWGIDYRIKNAKTKFEKFTSSNFCHPISHCVLEPLEKCTIKELVLELESYDTDLRAYRKFLKVQEKNLKKLTARQYNLGFLGDLKDLRLEYLDYSKDYDRTDVDVGHFEATRGFKVSAIDALARLLFW